ncbi:MAG: NUDIX domain-containing protein [Candidatus Hodarchaeota archaeon]
MYCLKCGSLTEKRSIENRPRSVCPQCGNIFYENLKVGVAAIIEKKASIWLLQRAHEPFRLKWNLPAGYVEIDEHPSQAVVREVKEETGLDVTMESLINIYFFDDDPRGNGILIVYVSVNHIVELLEKLVKL